MEARDYISGPTLQGFSFGHFYEESFALMVNKALASWSGGKDSCLALWRSQKAGLGVEILLTALDETGLRTRSHGVTKELITAQGNSLGMANEFISATWNEYEERFVEILQHLANQGVKQAIFGDIDLLPHREWEEMVCFKAGIKPVLPLWNENRLEIVNEFLSAGFRARVVCVDSCFLDESFVGVEFDGAFIESLPGGVDPCGENGEFHTFVYDGPNFVAPVKWKSVGKETYVSPKEYGSQKYYFDILDEFYD